MDDTQEIPLSQIPSLSPPTPITPRTQPYAPTPQTPAAAIRTSPPGLERRQNPNPQHPSEQLIHVIEDKLKPTFNQAYNMIFEATELVHTPADQKYFNPVLKEMQAAINRFISTGGKRKTKRRYKKYP
jgi:hypothetical protein